MAKRFTDTSKWDKAWFRKLPCRLKCAWEYLLGKCDHAGVWNVDMETLSYFVGEKVTIEDLKLFFGDKIVIFEDGAKLWLISFFEFQYSTAADGFKAKVSALKILLSHGLIHSYGTVKEQLPNSSITVQELSKDCPSISIGISKSISISKEKGGAGEKTLAPVVQIDEAQIKACLEDYKRTLEHFGITRPLHPNDRFEIGRAIQKHGADTIKYVFAGARKQKKTRDYDPAHYVSLAIYFHPKRIERLVNVGSGKESPEGIDWAAVWKVENQ